MEVAGATYDSVKQHETGDLLLVSLFLTGLCLCKQIGSLFHVQCPIPTLRLQLNRL
jgi:hypothetical protein